MQRRVSDPARSPSEVAAASTEAEVRKQIAAFAAAIREGHIEEIMSFYADDLVAFDMVPPLRFTMKSIYQHESWERCFTDYFKFPVVFDYVDQKVRVSGDLAIAYGLVHVVAESKKGKKMDSWLRNTLTLAKIDGEWLVTHEHNSVPLDEETGEGLMNLPPEKTVH